MTNTVLPGIFERVKALVLDSIVLILLMIFFTYAFSLVTIPDWLRGVSFLFVFVFYDPLMTSFTGGTVGHKVVGIAVKRVNERTRNISLIRAVIRFVVKSSLGVISLFYVTSNDENQALHDLLAGSIVVYKN